MVHEYLKNEPTVSIEPLYDLLRNCAASYKKYCALSTALELGVFEHLTVPKTVEDLAVVLGTSLTLTRLLCEILRVEGLIIEEDDKYKNAQIAEVYLRLDTPMSQHEVIKNMANGLKLWEKLGDRMRIGPVAINEEKYFSNNLIHSLAREALSGELQRTVSIVAQQPEFKDARKLLDLGGGHGLYTAALTALNPALKAYVYDFPDVIKDTRKYMTQFCATKVEMIEGNFFTDD